SRSVKNRGAGLTKVRVIQYVEEFRTEFQVHSFAYLSIFRKRGVPDGEARTDQRVLTYVAEFPRAWKRISRWIKVPLAACRIGGVIGSAPRNRVASVAGDQIR